MDERELDEVFEALVVALQQAEMQWIVDQVRVELASGLTVAEAKRGEPDGIWAAIPRRMAEPDVPPLKTRLTTRPYSGVERVELAIEAIRRSIGDVQAIESAVLEAIPDLEEMTGTKLSDVPLGVDADLVGASAVPLASPSTIGGERQSALTELDALLDELVGRLRG